MVSFANEDMFDSRDVEDKIQELEAELEPFLTAAEALADNITDEQRKIAEEALLELTRCSADDLEDYRALCKLRDDVSSSEWDYGVQFISENHFKDYCQQLVEDIGDMPRNLPSYVVIDWAATAENLAADYSAVEFDGVTYLYRD